jgi:hypothetical protein
MAAEGEDAAAARRRAAATDYRKKLLTCRELEARARTGTYAFPHCFDLFLPLARMWIARCLGFSASSTGAALPRVAVACRGGIRFPWVGLGWVGRDTATRVLARVICLSCEVNFGSRRGFLLMGFVLVKVMCGTGVWFRRNFASFSQYMQLTELCIKAMCEAYGSLCSCPVRW